MPAQIYVQAKVGRISASVKICPLDINFCDYAEERLIDLVIATKNGKTPVFTLILDILYVIIASQCEWSLDEAVFDASFIL